jgi:hypothetical protein
MTCCLTTQSVCTSMTILARYLFFPEGEPVICFFSSSAGDVARHAWLQIWPSDGAGCLLKSILPMPLLECLSQQCGQVVAGAKTAPQEAPRVCRQPACREVQASAGVEDCQAVLRCSRRTCFW